jgi:hypothetical protein
MATPNSGAGHVANKKAPRPWLDRGAVLAVISAIRQRSSSPGRRFKPRLSL